MTGLDDRKTDWFGPWAVVGAAFLWSLDGFLRRSLYVLPAPVIVFWEHILGGLIAFILVAGSLKEFKKFTTRQWWAITAVSLLSGAIGTILYTGALTKIQFIPFSVVVLLQQLQPLFTIGLAKLVLKERIDWKFLAITVVALAAAYGVSFPNLQVNLATGAGTAIAAIMAIGAAASWGSSTVLSKYALQGTSSIHVTAARFWITPIFALLIAGFMGSAGQLFPITVPQLDTLLMITFTTGFAALGLYYIGLKRVPASLSTILELTWPVSALLVGFFFFQDRLSVTQWLSTALLMGTMLYLSKHRSQLSPLER